MLENLVDELEADGRDFDLKLTIGKECAWSGEVRITTMRNDDGPDESIVFFSVGGHDAEAVAERLLIHYRKWKS
jgi:hypothetical protein